LYASPGKLSPVPRTGMASSSDEYFFQYLKSSFPTLYAPLETATTLDPDSKIVDKSFTSRKCEK
jgi:hypothetical protein